MMIELGVNIDHVATVRQARRTYEPDPVWAAVEAHLGGADGITVHLREDRRHIQDEDVRRLRELTHIKLNLEMAPTPEMVEIARRIRPEMAMLVPEGRQEITTEGGLDVVGQFDALHRTVSRLQAAGIRVSMFVEPDEAQILASARLGANMVELHTGAFANAQGEAQLRELERIRVGAEIAHAQKLQVNAGHGINYVNIKLIRTVPHLRELNIGHSIISRSVFVGLENAVKEMLTLMNG